VYRQFLRATERVKQTFTTLRRIACTVHGSKRVEGSEK